MEADRKIDKGTPDLLLKYRDVVKNAAEKGVREALAKHKATGNSVAVSRDGEVVLIHPEKIATEYTSLDRILSNNEDDVYAELLEK